MNVAAINFFIIPAPLRIPSAVSFAETMEVERRKYAEYLNANCHRRSVGAVEEDIIDIYNISFLYGYKVRIFSKFS